MSSLERAATAPAAGLAWQRREGSLLLSPSGFLSSQQQLANLSIGPLHRAPSRSGSTVQTGETLDGASLVPAMQGGAGPRPHALSVYPRCPADVTNSSDMFARNDCCTVERSAFFSLGVSLRTDAWRYTEWPLWNGSALAPQWEAPLIGAELYEHTGDDGSSFDGSFEVLNLANDPQYASVRAQLSAQLRAAYARGSGP